MFTTGSKLYFGLAALAAAALGRARLGDGLADAGDARRGVGAHRLRLPGRPDALHPGRRDQPGGRRRPTEAAPAPRHAAWALAAGFGAALAGIGMALDTRLFIVGLVIVGLSVVEWAVQSWADRASTDPVYNDRVRGRLMHPLEFPVAGLLVRRTHRVRLLPGDGRPLEERCHRRVRRRRRDRHGPRRPAGHPPEGLADRRRWGPQRLRHHRPGGRRGRDRGRGAVLPPARELLRPAGGRLAHRLGQGGRGRPRITLRRLGPRSGHRRRRAATRC